MSVYFWPCGGSTPSGGAMAAARSPTKSTVGDDCIKEKAGEFLGVCCQGCIQDFGCHARGGKFSV